MIVCFNGIILSPTFFFGYFVAIETGSEDDGLLDMSEDDFFLSGSSSDEADADDEWTDKSTRYLPSLQKKMLFFKILILVR